MRKFLLLLSFVFMLTSHSWGQNQQRIGTAIQNVGSYARLIPRAQITVCQYNVQLQCNTPITIYSDSALTKPLSIPYSADNNANYSYYAQAGTYVEQVCATLNQCYTVPVTLIAGSGSVAGNPAAPAFAVQLANSTVTGFQADPNITINPTTHNLNAYSLQNEFNASLFSSPSDAVTQACSTSQKAIYFPAGVYTTGVPLACSGLHIRCAAASDRSASTGGTIFRITGANWGLYNPNADVTSPGQSIQGVTVDNCTWDISTDPANVLGAWRIKGILFSHFNNNQIVTSNNANPAITMDGGNFVNNAGDYDNVFVGNNLWDNGGVNTNGIGWEAINSSNNNTIVGGSVSRFGTGVYILFGNNNTFEGVDGENYQQYCIRMDSNLAFGNEFNRFRCESGLGPWFPNNAEALNLQIIDSNGNRQIVTTAGTTDVTPPIWATTIGATTTSGTVTYTLNRILPADVLATGSTNNSIDAYESGYQTGVVDTTGLNNYPYPISQGAPAAGGVQQTFVAWSSSVKQVNGYFNTNQQDTSSVYSGGCADGFHFGCFAVSGITGGEIQASRAYLLCNAATGIGCTGYVSINTNATGPQTITIPYNGGTAASFLISGQNVTLTPTATATAPTPNFGSQALIWTGSYYTGQLAFARYLSGGAFTGTGVCNVDTFNNSSTATATLQVTSGAVPTNTQLTLTSIGSGATAPPTTAVMNGTCTGGATASGTINLTNVVLGAGSASYVSNLIAPQGTGSNPGLILQFLPSGTTSQANSIEPINSDILMFNNNNATSGANFAPNKISLWGHSWNGSANANDIWTFTPTIAAGSNPAATLTIAHSGPGTGILALPSGTTVGGVPISAATLSGTTASIGGSPVTAGTCATGTATGITGATTSMVAVASPNTYPGTAFTWNAQVTSAGTVTVYVCTSLAAGATPTSSTYNVRVIQ
jgi:hypothetical protein